MRAPKLEIPWNTQSMEGLGLRGPAVRRMQEKFGNTLFLCELLNDIGSIRGDDALPREECPSFQELFVECVFTGGLALLEKAMAKDYPRVLGAFTGDPCQISHIEHRETSPSATEQYVNDKMSAVVDSPLGKRPDMLAEAFRFTHLVDDAVNLLTGRVEEMERAQTAATEFNSSRHVTLSQQISALTDSVKQLERTSQLESDTLHRRCDALADSVIACEKWIAKHDQHPD